MKPTDDFPLTKLNEGNFMYYLKAFATWLTLTLAALFSFSIVGCSHAGPYVSRITPTSIGLEIEKCYVDFYYITGNIATGKCMVDQIDLRK